MNEKPMCENCRVDLADNKCCGKPLCNYCYRHHQPWFHGGQREEWFKTRHDREDQQYSPDSAHWIMQRQGFSKCPNCGKSLAATMGAY